MGKNYLHSFYLKMTSFPTLYIWFIMLNDKPVCKIRWLFSKLKRMWVFLPNDCLSFNFEYIIFGLVILKKIVVFFIHFEEIFFCPVNLEENRFLFFFNLEENRFFFLNLDIIFFFYIYQFFFYHIHSSTHTYKHI